MLNKHFEVYWCADDKQYQLAVIGKQDVLCPVCQEGMQVCGFITGVDGSFSTWPIAK